MPCHPSGVKIVVMASLSNLTLQKYEINPATGHSLIWFGRVLGYGKGVEPRLGSLSCHANLG